MVCFITSISRERFRAISDILASGLSWMYCKTRKKVLVSGILDNSKIRFIL
jgi:hypothetical protein